MSDHEAMNNVVFKFDVSLDAFGLIHKATISITLNGSETDAILRVREFLVEHWEAWAKSRLRDEFLAFLSEAAAGTPL
ncbi:hypothetical protein GSI_02254 [Ganoderma sinense ZZ0214-1]|uniref:Uncharacterized protein n=1 Tax=Ganoderma sinense ZZ0214-1 TaxID=1077348 RepID=A0A2G8SP21_9APHY|nr:hypothetical protein GSI_02254 [Ganoderma sinense ZZ0214-1]